MKVKQSLDEMRTDIAKGIEKLDLKTGDHNKLMRRRKKKQELHDKRKRNIIDQSLSKVREHIEDETYVETRTVQICEDILEQYGLVILSAGGGSGKSKLGLQLASRYIKKDCVPMIFIDNEIKHRRDMIDLNEKCVIIVEDMFGRTNVRYIDEEHTNILDMLLNFTRQTNNVKIILTLRSDNCNCKSAIFNKHSIFADDIIVDLDNQWPLTEAEKRQILKQNMKKFRIEQCSSCVCLEDEIIETPNGTIQICQSVMEDIVVCNARAGYPNACRLFCIDKNLTKLGVKYFTNTTQCLVNQMNELFVKGLSDQISKYEYSILLYVALKGRLDGANIVRDLLWKHIFLKSLWRDRQRVSHILLENAITGLNGKYLICKQTGNQIHSYFEYVFHHQSIHEAVLISYGTEHPKELLDAVDLHFIDEYILADTSTSHDFMGAARLKVPQQLLVERITKLLNTDALSFYQVGKYIRNQTLINRNDSLFNAFIDVLPRIHFENVHLRLLCDVLTNDGKCSKLFEYHPIVCEEFFTKYGSIYYVTNFCRPDSSTIYHSKFVILQDDNIIKKIFDLLKKVPPKAATSYMSYLRTIGRYLHTVGIKEGNVGFVTRCLDILLENLLMHAKLIKIFVDGLTLQGSCQDALTIFCDFFEKASKRGFDVNGYFST